MAKAALVERLRHLRLQMLLVLLALPLQLCVRPVLIPLLTDPIDLSMLLSSKIS